MLTKRPNAGRNGGKPKDGSSNKGSNSGIEPSEINLVVHFPFIKTTETDLVSHYYHILKQNDTKGMDLELDALQMDLEKLLSSVAIRNRIFQTEIKLLEKRGKAFERQSTSGKRKKQDDKLISQKETLQKISKTHYNFKPNKSGHNSLNMSSGPSLETVATDIRKLNIPKITLPKNDTANRFWVMVNEYCRPVTTEDVNLLDQLIEDHKEAELKIPELGCHYSNHWNEIDLSLLGGLTSKKNDLRKNDDGPELARKGESAALKVGTVPGPLTQRLVLALMEDNVPNTNRLNRKSAHNRDTSSMALPPLSDALCIERRLRKELIDAGILEASDLPEIESDSITEEMKRVHQELVAVSKQNTAMLTRLKENTSLELARQRLIRRLDEIDKEIINQYNTIISYKLKQEEIPADVSSYAIKLIKKQEELCTEMEMVTPIKLRFLSVD